MPRLALTGLILAASIGAAGRLQAQNPPMAGHNMPMGGKQCEAGAECPQSGMMDPEMMAMMNEMQGMMKGMMAIHAYDPAKLLEKKTDLSLTSSQIKSLEGLAAEIKTAKDHAKAQHEVAHARIVAEFDRPKPDAAKVKADGQEAMQDMAASHGMELSAMARAKGLLTDTQRAKVDSAVKDHGAMMDHKTHQ